MSDVLEYAGGAAIRAAVTHDPATRLVEMRAVQPGEQFDICVPSGSQETADVLLANLALNYHKASGSVLYEGGIGFLQGALNGELYVQQVKAAGLEFNKAAENVALAYSKAGKYTPEHARAIIDARIKLEGRLSGIFPPATFYRSVPVETALRAEEVTSELEEAYSRLASLKGKTVTNSSRKLVKKALDGVNAAADTRVVMQLKIAEKLKVANKLLIPVQLLPQAGVLLTSNRDEDRKRALGEIAGKLSGIAAGAVAAETIVTMCVVFGVSTMGWGLLACGVAPFVADIIIGQQVERLMTPMLRD